MRRLTKAQREEKIRFIHQVGGAAGCLKCGNNTRIQAMHIKFSDAASGKAHPGHTNKDDYYMVPGCVDCHELQHKMGNEREWWKPFDVLSIAAKLHITWEKGDHQGGCDIIEGSRSMLNYCWRGSGPHNCRCHPRLEGQAMSYLSFDDFQKALWKSREDAIEECALVAEKWHYGADSAAAIRALKDKP